jgi:tripartite-type tricarboxylate transporter receptor subunit TctC
MLRLFAATALSAVGALAISAPARADAIEDFYRGKQIDMIIGYSPGGTYDLYARLVARFLGDYIPGKPRVIPRNMPGAGSRLAAGWIYNLGPKDGTVIGTGDQSLAVEQAMGDKALTIDVSKFQYIGNPAADNNTTGGTRAASGRSRTQNCGKCPRAPPAAAPPPNIPRP